MLTGRNITIFGSLEVFQVGTLKGVRVLLGMHPRSVQNNVSVLSKSLEAGVEALLRRGLSGVWLV